MKEYIAYIYLWYDTKSKFFYLGGHKGQVKDSYICSSKSMKRAFNKRPSTFRFRVLEYITVNDNKHIRQREQFWLNQIKDTELMTTENVKNKTCRYYNVKKISSGGNGKGTNTGNKNIGGHQRQNWIAIEPCGFIHHISKSYEWANALGKSWSNLWPNHRKDIPIKRGEWAGWKLHKENCRHSVSRLAAAQD